jgi:peroxiredoxin
MRADIVPGAVFPDYELTDHLGAKRRLSELQREHPYLRSEMGNPMVLVLGRGHYCPKDQLQHRDLVTLYPKMAVAYNQLVTILPDELGDVQDFREGVGAPWTFLSDAGHTIPRDLDIWEYTTLPHQPTIPHTFVLEPGLKIYKVYNGYWFWGRPSTEELWQDLRAVSRKVRPDWDLGAPGLRAAWDAGDKRRFYPYEGERWWQGQGATGDAQGQGG